VFQICGNHMLVAGRRAGEGTASCDARARLNSTVGVDLIDLDPDQWRRTWAEMHDAATMLIQSRSLLVHVVELIDNWTALLPVDTGRHNAAP
jgi:hypothetical protein